MRVLFLGTGTSHGVPMIGCACAVCRSSDPRDRRLRPSLYLVTDDGLAVLVDTSPDLRQQALAHGIDRVDAVLFTHGHADHVMGFDELRAFNHLHRRPIPCYADETTCADLRRTFAYAFDPAAPRGGGVPEVSLFAIAGPFSLGRTEVQPVPVWHGARPVLGFRFGRFAYVTDCSRIPDASWPLLEGVECLVLDALRERPHPTHFSLSEAVAAARRLGAARVWFTHICHDLPHAATCARLPAGMALAYDGLIVDV